MNDMTTLHDAIGDFPRHKAQTLRFSCGAPRSATAIGDGSRALFLRSDGPEDLVTSLWLSVLDADGTHREVLLADPRVLLADADDEDVPAEEKARRERAREGGSGIVSYSVDAAGRRVVFTINGQLFLTEIAEDGSGRTRMLAADGIAAGEGAMPVLNPRISPDGRHVAYTTGEHLMLVDIAPQWPSDSRHDDATDDDCDGQPAPHAHGHRCGDEESGAPYDPSADKLSTLWSVYPDDDADENTWKIGLAEFVAGEEMDRYDGFWWGPDSRHIIFETFNAAPEPMWYISDPANPQTPASGRRYARALTSNADVRLTLAELAYDGHDEYAGLGIQQISWNRKDYEYVAAVHWSAGHEPLLLVQNRRQTRDQVLSVHLGSEASAGSAPVGSTTVLEEHANDQWLDIIQGTPAFTPDGRLICALNDMDADTNRLTVDGRPFTPAGWQVREVLDVTDEDVLAVVQRTPELDGYEAPDGLSPWRGDADGHDARSFDVVSFDYDGNVLPMTARPGSWSASRCGEGLVISGRDMDSAKSVMSHSFTLRPVDGGAAPENDGDGSAAMSTLVCPIDNHAAEPGFAPNVRFARLGEHRLYTAIIAPSADSPYAKADRLPVLLKPYGGPGFQQVVFNQAYYWDAQWWADQGFLVVTADGRGTTGRGPRWDREIFENMKDVTLADQVEAVHALAQAVEELNRGTAQDGDASRIPAPDLDKVCMIGWSYGGFLSALAVLDAPDVVKAACAGAPPTDWTLYDTHYTERYLGLDPAAYERNSIIADAPKLARPLMLIHGFADDNVTIAHSLRLSQALMAAGRPHTFLPLTGITHMTNDPVVAENLLTLQRDFLRDALDL